MFESQNQSSLIKRLIREYDHINWYYRLGMMPPVLRLMTTSSKYGEWDPNLREIRLSMEIFTSKPWHIAVEVLKHEMAHQYVAEVMHVTDQHGEAFQQACDRLRMESWARRASIADAFMTSDAADDERTVAFQRLQQRAEKLLSLATSSNEHEAALAMQRVRELYARYNFDPATAPQTLSDFTTFTIYLNSQKTSQHHAMIASLLNEFFGVRVIHASYFNVSTGEDQKCIELAGTKPNVLMAEHVYVFLERSLASLWKEHLRQCKGERERGAKRSFYLGVLAGFREKLRSQKIEVQDQTVATSASSDRRDLALRPDPKLDEFFKYRFPRLRTHGFSNSFRSRDSFDAGRSKGRDIVINRPIANAGSKLRFFLGSSR
jgi:hypothetical protein